LVAEYHRNSAEKAEKSRVEELIAIEAYHESLRK